MDEAAAMPEPGPDAYARMFELIDLLTPHAMRIAVTLGIPRLIAAGVTSAAGLAAESGAHAATLRSVLRHLASRGVLHEREGGSFTLTDVGRTLLHPHATAALDLASAPAQMDLAWAGLRHCVETGEPGYATVHGRGFWDHIGSDPALAASFDRYLEDHAGWRTPAARLPVWPAGGTAVDIGGGAGGFLSELLERHPSLGGILVDLPAVARRARVRFDGRGLAGRATVVPGSFFDPLPRGHDVYILAHVLHDWPDVDAGRILARVAEAAAPTSRLVLVEQVVDPGAPTADQVRSDLLMRLLFASGERTAAQWTALLAAAGLHLARIHPLDGFRSVIEAVPRAD
jgi:hypothetical protein